MSTIPLLFQKANYAKNLNFMQLKKGTNQIYKTWDDCKLQVDKFQVQCINLLKQVRKQKFIYLKI